MAGFTNTGGYGIIARDSAPRCGSAHYTGYHLCPQVLCQFYWAMGNGRQCIRDIEFAALQQRTNPEVYAALSFNEYILQTPQN